MTEVIEKIRKAAENEFFFTVNSNIGASEEFQRLINFINENSNIEVIRNDVESIKQLRNGSNYMGSSYNFKVVKNDK